MTCEYLAAGATVFKPRVQQSDHQGRALVLTATL